VSYLFKKIAKFFRGPTFWRDRYTNQTSMLFGCRAVEHAIRHSLPILLYLVWAWVSGIVVRRLMRSIATNPKITRSLYM